MAIDITNKNEKQIALTGAEIESALLKANDIQSSASEIDNAVANHVTQSELDALALSTGNLTASQVTTIDNLSGLTANAEEMNSINSNFILSKNLFNKDDIKSDYTIDGSGNLLSYASITLSNYIPITPSTTYVTSALPRKYIYYTQSGVYISAIVATATVFTTPSNAYYMYITFITANSNLNTFQIEKGSVSTDYNGFNVRKFSSNVIQDFNKEVSSITTIVGDEYYARPQVGKNVFNVAAIEGGYLPSVGTDELVDTSGNYRTSEYISCLQGNTYVVTPSFLRVYGYDSDKNFVSSGVTTSGNTFTIANASVKYFRISAAKDYMDNMPTYYYQVELGTIATYYEPYLKTLTPKIVPMYDDRTIKPTMTTLTVNSDPDSDADFTGRSGLQDAIDSIIDASVSNQYTLKCYGAFEATETTHYQTFGATGENFISIKDFVNVIGSADFKIVATLDAQEDTYVPVLWNGSSNLENCEIVAHNNRYGMHIEGSGTDNRNKKRTFRNIKISHSNTAIGYGLSTGEELYCEDSTFHGDKLPIYIHNNGNFANSCKVEFTRCKFTGGDGRIIQVQSLGSMNKDNIIFNDCSFDKGAVLLLDAFDSQLNDSVEHSEMLVSIADKYPFETKTSFTPSCLKIVSKSQGVSSTVRFDTSSSAFDDIIGRSYLSATTSDKYFRKSTSGYSYVDGTTSLSGFALSGLNISEYVSATGNRRALGKRLGDCSTINKTLIIIVNGVSYEVVFNKNYNGTLGTAAPSYTNQQIINEILAVIGSVCTVSMYSYSQDYYPAYKGNKTATNGGVTPILAGMGIVYTSRNSIRRAVNTDNKIDGIAIDEIGVGNRGRIITGGRIYHPYSGDRFSIKAVSAYDAKAGDEFGITEGLFDKNASPKLLRCVYDGVLEFIEISHID